MSRQRLIEIKDEIKTLLEEAKQIIRYKSSNSITWERARSYWYAHIMMALDKEHDYLGGSMFTMEDTINELEEVDEDDEEFSDEDQAFADGAPSAEELEEEQS